MAEIKTEYKKKIATGKINCHCPKHGDYTASVSVIFGSRFISSCPECVETENKIKQQKIDLEKYKAMNIEPEYFRSTFENYVAETPSQKKAFVSVKKLVAGQLKKIIIVGGNGTGKTHLGVVAVKSMGGKILTMFEIGLYIRQSYATGKAEIEVLDELATLPLLVIDELGRTKNSDSDKNNLSYILDKRHVRGLPTFLQVLFK